MPWEAGGWPPYGALYWPPEGSPYGPEYWPPERSSYGPSAPRCCDPSCEVILLVPVVSAIVGQFPRNCTSRFPRGRAPPRRPGVRPPPDRGSMTSPRLCREIGG